jgi:hypothetical protein
MALLSAVLEDACTDQGGVVLLASEPSIGKTRTAEELGLQATQRGAQVLWGRCYESGGAKGFLAHRSLRISTPRVAHGVTTHDERGHLYLASRPTP